MMRSTHSFFVAVVCAASVAAQTWGEQGAGELSSTAEWTIGDGPLTQINGNLNTGEAADLYVVHVDDIASFTCTSVGGATFDTQMWMWTMTGHGISFRDDNPGSVRSTLTGQFLNYSGRVIIGISQYDRDCQDSAGQQLWLDQPFAVERAPDGPGASNAFTQWSGLTPAGGAYTLKLGGASFAGRISYDEAQVAWATIQTPSGAPPTTFAVHNQRTPTGEPITVDRASVGRFVVNLPRSMNVRGAPHVTARGGNHTAVIESWANQNGNIKVWVNVFDPSGAVLDAPFYFHFRAFGRDDERAAYLWADQPTASTYTPYTPFSWNGNRADPVIVRTAVGTYQVTLPGLDFSAFEEGNVQVSPCSGSGNAALVRASVHAWSFPGPNVQVRVRTFDAAGASSDEQFVLSYHESFAQAGAPIPRHLGSGAHLWADDPTAIIYAPDTRRVDSNGTYGPLGNELCGRVSTGVYEAILWNVAPVPGFVAMATAYGRDSYYASIESALPNTQGNGTAVRVHTYDATGAPADTRFTLLYLSDHPAGTPGSNATIGAGCAGLVLNPETRPVLNSAWDMSLADLPTTSLIGFVSLGFSNPSFPLGVLGAPGCSSYQDQASLNTVTLPSASPSYSLAIPSTITLIGLEIFAQGGVFATGVNALNLATSNGVKGTIGDV